MPLSDQIGSAWRSAVNESWQEGQAQGQPESFTASVKQRATRRAARHISTLLREHFV
jgi:hypothetical protein